MSDPLPESVDVVIVGAGISGLVAARELANRGITDIAIVDALDRIGGRIQRWDRGNGSYLEAGGEWTCESQELFVGLAEAVGLSLDPAPMADGKVVRFKDGERLEEAYPLELESEQEAYHALIAAIDEAALAIPNEAPWTAPDAAELDGQTLKTWLEARCDSARVREYVAVETNFCGGDFGELSALYVLWLIGCFGGWEAMEMQITHRLEGGTSELVARVAAPFADRTFLGAPVRLISRDDDGVMVETDRGAVRGKAVIVSVPPMRCAGIEWVPPLPGDRARLQTRYLEGPGLKMIAFYDHPWWRERGYNGFILGGDTAFLALDTSPADNSAGVLTLFAPLTGAYAAAHAAELGDDAVLRVAVEADIRRAFGDDSPAPSEFHAFCWQDRDWTCGASIGLPPGVLSTVGPALRRPVGRVLWAGAATGLPQVDWIEGAISAGMRSAAEAAELV